MPLDGSDVVNLTTRISAAGNAPSGHGVTMFVTTESTILSAGGSGRTRTYRTLAAVGADFLATTEIYRAAQIHFARERPKEFKVTRWAQSAVATTITGGAAPASVATIEAITTGSITLGGVSITGIDFDTDATYADVAATLQAAIRANSDSRFVNMTVSYTNSRIVLSFPNGAEVGSSLSGGATGTDMSTHLGLNATQNPVLVQGSGIETIATCLDNTVTLTPFYFVCLERSLNGTASMVAAGDWCAARSDKQFYGQSSESTALTVNETTSQLAILTAKAYPRSTTFWTSRAADYLAVSAAAYLGGVNPGEAGSATTLNLKTAPGITAEDLDTLSEAQFAELQRKQTNAFRLYDGGGGIRDGRSNAAGRWTDQRYFLDWLTIEGRRAVFNYMRRRYPTRAGVRAVLVRVFNQAVIGGWIGSGVVSTDMRQQIANTFRLQSFDGILSAGYLIYVPPVETLTQAMRDNREGGTIKAWLKGTPVINNIDIAVDYEA